MNHSRAPRSVASSSSTISKINSSRRSRAKAAIGREIKWETFVQTGVSRGVTTNNDLAVASCNNDGPLDRRFGPGGVGYVTTDINGGAEDKATGMAIDGSGRLVVAGWTGAEGTRDFA